MKTSSSSKRRRQKKNTSISKTDQDILIQELRRLRSLFAEVADSYIIRVSAMIQQLVEAVEGTGIGGVDSKERLSLDQYEQIMSSIRNLVVKAKRGRRKDLKQIEDLAAEIDRTIDT
ncbi:MAG: hypothetical protein ABIH23_11720 [bacterium]